MTAVDWNMVRRLYEASAKNPDTSCREWAGCVDHKRGYGYVAGTTAHRVIYSCLVGDIPEGKVIHHKCNNRACVNPAHLEHRGRGENALLGNHMAWQRKAQTRCKRGHEFTPENTGVNAKGCRYCKTCNREAVSLRYHTNSEYRANHKIYGALWKRRRREARKAS